MRTLTVGGCTAVLLAALVFGPANTALAADSTVTIDAPATAKQLWVDLELPGLAVGDYTVSYRMPAASASWSPLPVRATAFGATGIVSASAGRYEVRLSSSAASATDIVLTLATRNGAVVATQREVLAGEPTGGGDGSAGEGSGTNGGSGSGGASNGSNNSGSTASGSLAQTGLDAVVWGATAAAALGAGGLLLYFSRRRVSRQGAQR